MENKIKQQCLIMKETFLLEYVFLGLKGTTSQDLSLVSRFTLSSLEPIKCTPFSPESAPKFGTLPNLNVFHVRCL